MSDADPNAQPTLPPENSPEKVTPPPPFVPRPRLFAALLGLFGLWIAALIALRFWA